MQKTALVCVLMFSSSPAFGQLESNSITVSVSRNSTVQPDQVVFAVTVQSPLSTNLDDVIAAVQTSGITAANFTGVRSSFVTVGPVPLVPPLSWTFTLSVPFAKQTDTVASLTALQLNIGQNKSRLTMSFTISGTQVSTQVLQSQTCSLSGLISDAQAQAQNIAVAAGVTVGPILALSSAASGPAPAAFNFVSGAFASVYVAPTSAPPCGLTVKFGLWR